VPGCTSTPHSPGQYTYIRKSCKKLKGLHISDALPPRPETVTSKSAREATSGDWVMYSSGDPHDRVWLGRLVPNPEWANLSPSFVNETAADLLKFGIGEITLKAGEVALQVQWYQRLNEDRSVRKKDKTVQYVVAANAPQPQSVKYLVHCDFNAHMTQMTGKPSQKAYSRRLRTGKSAVKEDFRGRIVTSYSTTTARARKELQKETWELATPTYFNGCEIADAMASYAE